MALFTVQQSNDIHRMAVLTILGVVFWIAYLELPAYLALPMMILSAFGCAGAVCYWLFSDRPTTKPPLSRLPIEQYVFAAAWLYADPAGVHFAAFMALLFLVLRTAATFANLSDMAAVHRVYRSYGGSSDE